jgi:hypothetical protein
MDTLPARISVRIDSIMPITRRDMLATTLAAGVVSASAAETTKSSFYELRHFQMRTDRTDQNGRTRAFLTGVYMPAAKKAGAGPIGVFTSQIAPSSPFLLCLTSYPSLAAMESARDKLAASDEYLKALTDFDSAADPAYERMESWVLRAFDFFPEIELLPPDPKRPARMFEMRTYESANETLLRRKIKMFGSGEVGIFRRVGLQPVWFGEAIAGSKLPHLTYMVAFENLAAREKNWAGFGSDPEWVKLRSTPEFAVPPLVSNISNMILSPVNGSDIR